jgi:hypothetical protein
MEDFMKTILVLLLTLVCMLVFSVSSFAADQAELTGKTAVSSFEPNKSAKDCTAGFAVRGNEIILAANCIEKGLQCTLNGTPCCAPYECKGKFPITTCK